jgi:glycosyltransferase involved in cell wall biosynthesis
MSHSMGQRIVILANDIDGVGGAQRVAHSLANGLALRGYDVELAGIVPFEPRHTFISEPAYRTRVLGDRPQPVREDEAGRQRLRELCCARLDELLREGPPGIVITTQVWAMEHLAEIDHRGWRVIGQYHSSFEAAASGPELDRLRSAYADIDAFALLTDEDAQRFRQAGLNNTCAIPNAVSFFPDRPAALATNTLTYLGRLSVEKGPQVLVEAWGRLAASHPDWSLQFVGDGPDQPTVRAMVDRLPEGAERISFHGPVTDPERLLLDSDLVVLPSLVEGFPLVLAESMACGVPVVATDCSAGVRALLKEGVTGLLAARGDSGSLSRALSTAMESRELRVKLGSGGRMAARELLPDQILGRWEALFSDVLR